MPEEFDWNRFVELARRLALPPASGQEVDEAAQRAAIGRAYYAAFHHVKSVVETVAGEPAPAGAGVHKWIRDQFKRVGWNRKQKTAHQKFDALRRMRGWADYEPTPTADLATTVADSVVKASSIVDVLRPEQTRLQ